jgi:hypothetical protein
MPKYVRSDTAVVGDKIVRGGTAVGRDKADRKCKSVRSDTATVKDKAAWRWKSVRDDIAFVRNKASGGGTQLCRTEHSSQEGEIVRCDTAVSL